MSFGAYDVTTRPVTAPGVLGTASTTGFSVTQNTTGQASSAPASNPADGAYATRPNEFYLQLPGYVDGIDVPGLSNLLRLYGFSFGGSRSSTTLNLSDLSVVVDADDLALAQLLRLATNGATIPTVNLLGYNELGQVYKLALGGVTVSSVSMQGVSGESNAQLSLSYTSFVQTSANVSAQGNIVDLVSSSFDTATSTGTAYAVTPTTLIPVPIGPLNSAPLAVADAFFGAGGITVGAANGLFANDSDPDGNALVGVTIVQAPANGTLAVNIDGSFTFTPTGGYTGDASFIYRTADPFGAQSASALVSLQVYFAGATPGNDSLTGTQNDDLFNLGQGGSDTVVGGAGNDRFYFGQAFDLGDNVQGGAGTMDRLLLQGYYTGGTAITFAASQIADVEILALLSYADRRRSAYDRSASISTSAIWLAAKVIAVPPV